MKCYLAYRCVSYLLQNDAFTPWESAIYLLMCDVISLMWNRSSGQIFSKIKRYEGRCAAVSYQSCSGNVSDTALLVKALDNMTFVKTSSLMEYIFIRTNN